MPSHNSGSKHWDPSMRDKIREQVEFLEWHRQNISTTTLATKVQLFAAHGIPPRTGFRMLASAREHDGTTLQEETRGRKAKMTPEDVRNCDLILQRTGFDGKALTWSELLLEANLEVSSETLRRTLGTMDYRRCKACKATWISPSLAFKRVKWATLMLEKYPEPDDWKLVRFSDKSHAGWGAQGDNCTTSKPGERHCPECIQTFPESAIADVKDKKRVYFWAAIGYDYKSPLTRYKCGTDGRMTQTAYKAILDDVVAKWPRDWVLEENVHGPKGTSSVKQWKVDHHRKYFFNCAHSPDLSPMENAWQAPKEMLEKALPGDDDVWDLCQRGWNELSQETINA